MYPDLYRRYNTLFVSYFIWARVSAKVEVREWTVEPLGWSVTKITIPGNSGPDLSEASGENKGYYSVLMLEEPSFREVGETTG
jgi:hypothetical protein